MKPTSFQDNWKEKAKSRRLENKFLKQRLKELSISRANWKGKALARGLRVKELEAELECALKVLEKKDWRQESFNDSERPNGYVYHVALIQLLVIIKLKTSASFRAIGKIIFILHLHWGFFEKTPSHKTVLIWIQKIGYYELTKEKQQAEDWIILLDESIKIGQEKLLVILGIRESSIDFNGPLRFENLTPLLMMVQSSRNSQMLCEQVLSLQEPLGRICYAVGDYDGLLKKGLQLADIAHIHDITHKIALIVRKLYQNDEHYQAFTKRMVHMRNAHFQTAFAYIIPPRQRQKSRFHNISLISNWGVAALRYLQDNNAEAEVIEQLQWVQEYQALIEELEQINRIICQIEKEIKYHGLSKSSVKACHKILEEFSTPNAQKFKEELNAYFKVSLKLIPEVETLLATSDILESAFGKYKNYLNHNPMTGITNLALCIPAFTSNLDQQEIKQALENITRNDIQQWTEEKIGPSLLKKRRKAFSYVEKNGKKKKCA